MRGIPILELIFGCSASEFRRYHGYADDKTGYKGLTTIVNEVRKTGDIGIHIDVLHEHIRDSHPDKPIDRITITGLCLSVARPTGVSVSVKCDEGVAELANTCADDLGAQEYNSHSYIVNTRITQFAHESGQLWIRYAPPKTSRWSRSTPREQKTYFAVVVADVTFTQDCDS